MDGERKGNEGDEEDEDKEDVEDGDEENEESKLKWKSRLPTVSLIVWYKYQRRPTVSTCYILIPQLYFLFIP
ncbi:hypothetical protein JCGZ_19452 [Jatropha curcas]|uniref:Uncharacterized protein n=1 Tax=Jatropha curcas TaxID=180498 RepID=A0A067KBV4_JATCU|nr:hypothetical protein JCGZ_19452 [Jatropha curcas]